MPDVNVASTSLNAKVLSGDFSTELLTPNKSFDKFSRHAIAVHDPGIVVEVTLDNYLF